MTVPQLLNLIPEYWQKASRIMDQYGMTSEGGNQMDLLKMQSFGKQVRASNKKAFKTIDNSTPHTLREITFVDEYSKTWHGMSSPLINNWIKVDPVIKGYSAGAFTSMALIAGEAYAMEGISEMGWKSLGNAGLDAGGQYFDNLLFQKKGFTGSFTSINVSSVGASAFNPAGSFGSLIGNGLISNTFQFSLDEGYRIGTFTEVMTGTAIEATFGLILGNTEELLINNSKYFKLQSLNLDREVKSIPNLKLETEIGTVFFTDNAKKVRLNIQSQQNMNISNILYNTPIITGNAIQTSKNYTNDQINK